MPEQNSDQSFTQEKRLQDTLAGIKNKILVMSGKGGVGKTSVSVNLAYALAMSGKKVGILDADIHGPNIAKMLGIEGQEIRKSASGMSPVVTDHGLKAASMALAGLHSDRALIWRGPMKFTAIRQFLADIDWGSLDYLVIDCPPGTGDEPLTVCQLIPDLTGAVVVTTPQDVAILDSRKSVFFARELKCPVLGIVENMSGMTCPHCQHDIDIFKTGGGERAAKDLRVPFLGRIPFDPILVGLGDAGRPFIAHGADSNAAKAFQQVVRRIEETCEELNAHKVASRGL